MDPVTTTFLTFAIIILVASWVYLIISAANEDFTWGLFAIFLPPLAYLYGLFRWEQAGGAIKMALIGLGLLLYSLA